MVNLFFYLACFVDFYQYFHIQVRRDNTKLITLFQKQVEIVSYIRLKFRREWKILVTRKTAEIAVQTQATVTTPTENKESNFTQQTTRLRFETADHIEQESRQTQGNWNRIVL